MDGATSDDDEFGLNDLDDIDEGKGHYLEMSDRSC